MTAATNRTCWKRRDRSPVRISTKCFSGYLMYVRAHCGSSHVFAKRLGSLRRVSSYLAGLAGAATAAALQSVRVVHHVDGADVTHHE